MSKKTTVVPLAKNRARKAARMLIASDLPSRRLVLGIGKQRIAIDLFAEVSKLEPETGDKPAPILPINSVRKRGDDCA